MQREKVKETCYRGIVRYSKRSQEFNNNNNGTYDLSWSLRRSSGSGPSISRTRKRIMELRWRVLSRSRPFHEWHDHKEEFKWDNRCKGHPPTHSESSPEEKAPVTSCNPEAITHTCQFLAESCVTVLEDASRPMNLALVLPLEKAPADWFSGKGCHGLQARPWPLSRTEGVVIEFFVGRNRPSVSFFLFHFLDEVFLTDRRPSVNFFLFHYLDEVFLTLCSWSSSSRWIEKRWVNCSGISYNGRRLQLIDNNNALQD